MAREGKVIVKILKDICQELPFFGHSHQRSKVTIVKPCDNNLKKLECNLTFQQNSITQDNRANFVLNADGTKGVESGTPIKYIVKRFDDDVLAKEEVVLQDNFGWAFQEVLWSDKIPRGKRVKYVFRLEAGEESCEKELEYNKPATAICGENSLTKEEETNDYIKFRYKTYVSNFEDNLVRHLYKSTDGVNWSECPFTEENVHISDGSHVEVIYTVQKSSLQGETHFKASVNVMTKGQLELTCETGTIELNPNISDIKCSIGIYTSKQQQPSGTLYYVNISHGQSDVFPAHSFKMYLETIVDGISKGKELIYENATTGELQNSIQKEVLIDNGYFRVVNFKVTIELTNGTICEHTQTVLNFVCGNANFRKESSTIGTNLIVNVTNSLDSENPSKEFYLYGKNNDSNWETINVQSTENGDEITYLNVPEKDNYKLTVNYYFTTNNNGGTITEVCSYDWENQRQPPVQPLTGEVSLGIEWQNPEDMKDISNTQNDIKLFLKGMSSETYYVKDFFDKFTEMSIIQYNYNDPDRTPTTVRFLTESELNSINAQFKSRLLGTYGDLKSFSANELLGSNISLQGLDVTNGTKNLYIKYSWQYRDGNINTSQVTTNTLTRTNISCNAEIIGVQDSVDRYILTYKGTVSNVDMPAKVQHGVSGDSSNSYPLNRNTIIYPDVNYNVTESVAILKSTLHRGINRIKGSTSVFLKDPVSSIYTRVSVCISDLELPGIEPKDILKEFSVCAKNDADNTCKPFIYYISNQTRTEYVDMRFVRECEECRPIQYDDFVLEKMELHVGNKKIYTLQHHELSAIRAKMVNAENGALMYRMHIKPSTPIAWGNFEFNEVGDKVKWVYKGYYNGKTFEGESITQGTIER